MFLGIDIGTTAVKTIIVDENQRVVADAAVEHPTERPAPGLNEQSPDSWVGATEQCLDKLRTEVPAAVAAVSAIGLSGQMHSAVLLDRECRPLRPAMLWNDGRGSEECAAIARAVPDVGRLTGVIPMVGFSAAKILWVRNHEPDVFARVRYVMLAKDYVRLWLTAEVASDVSDGAGTQLLDQARRQWAPEMIAAVGLESDQMPRLHEGIEVAGTLRPAVAARFGLKPGLPVAAGGGDAGTGAVGVGCIDDHQGFISLGTAAVFVVVRDHYAPATELVLHNFAHCIPDRWFQMAGMLNGASCLAWILELIGEADAAAVLSRLEQRYRGPSRVIFLPYLTGERTPHNDPAARGVLFGLDSTTDGLDLIQAVLEGVAFSLKEADACLIAADCRCPEPGFIGGGARSTLWGRIVATVLGRPVRRYDAGAFGPALGAARLAIAAANDRPIGTVANAPANGAIIEPDRSLVDAYGGRYETYRRLYRSVRGLF